MEECTLTVLLPDPVSFRPFNGGTAMLLFSGNADMFFRRFPQAHPHMLVLKSLAFEDRLVLGIWLRTREQAQNEITMNILAL